MAHVGVNVGALTVKVVSLRGDETIARVAAHQGRPVEVLRQMLAADFADGAYFGVSGGVGHISEAAAIQRALRELGGAFDAVAALGGESFLVYILAAGKISGVLSHNQCAAGSGEFFVQQIGRMGLAIDDAIRLAQGGRVIPLASRCSVHCKSDITHKLNRSEATPQDILHTLHDSMADKVVSLLEQGQCQLRRVLVIGGVARNAAMLAALRAKLPTAEFVVLPQSPWFEAWGTALLTRDEPHYRAPQILLQPSLGSLPPLGRYADRVQVIAAPPQQAAPDGPLVLGVDAGSTTTKAVLLDPATRGVVAAHYARTQGDPVAATRQCLRALADQVGNLRVQLGATTGSAREVVGAFLGVRHVYNEISAHAAGATHFDPEVDTIFEIGGQDSKYIYLRNGVPIDYAMNNACSAGTGSFLEESCQGDLGVGVADIADVALAAAAPVQFKATCAAFINSDIRIAQQQGYTRDNIVAGLVYSIAANYLNRVKGPRFVGKKVFLQGGVALNPAVGHAFAHSVGRPVVIPPRPELLGALGVAVLALRRAAGVRDTETDLLTLAARDMKLVGHFTCGACKLYCTISRYEAAGRRFPFGGRCSLFENVWKRKARTTVIRDLVERRAEVLFGHPAGTQGGWPRIGIPRALTTHSLYPLYATFFAQLGMEAVLSGVDPRGELKSYSGFCLPAQIAHGAVLDLARQGVDLIFLPHVTHMPRAAPCRESYLCPITQASPYFLAKAFPGVRFLSPVLDFTDGYAACSTLVAAAGPALDVPPRAAERAWAAAVRAQTKAEEALRELGRQALERAAATGEPTVLLAGHSYNAFTPEASMSVSKKLTSMGVPVIPADCLAPVEQGPTAWHFANQILNAMALVQRHPNLFLLCVSNFSCTVDAFTHALVASGLGARPYLVLEIDGHTADGGVQTRLEAFLDIIRNYRGAQPAAAAEPFVPCRLVRAGRVARSNGEQVALSDPRVKLYFPNFSPHHSQAVAMVHGWLGLRGGEVLPLDRRQLTRGLQYTTGRECLPLPICIGQLLEVHDKRAPGEIAGFHMLRGGAPCVSDAYMGYLERFIVEQRLPDLFLVSPEEQNDYCGFDPVALARHLAPAVLVADLLVEIEHALHVVGAAGSLEGFRRDCERFVAASPSLARFQEELPGFVARLAALPRTRDPLTCPRVVVAGDFFTRFSPFFMEGVRGLYAERGVILKPVDLADLSLYVGYHSASEIACCWGMKPGFRATATACAKIFRPEGKEYLRNWRAYQAQSRSADSYRELFRKTGLVAPGRQDFAAVFNKASEHVSPKIFGETIPNIGAGLVAGFQGYDGVLLIGPFNCLPFRISEAILKPLCVQQGMPILTYESDGYAVSGSFLRQVEVHIQQVLDHAAAAGEGPTRQAPGHEVHPSKRDVGGAG